ncbi:unnamed protein product, partial [Pylaiella littoralis]
PQPSVPRLPAKAKRELCPAGPTHTHTHTHTHTRHEKPLTPQALRYFFAQQPLIFEKTHTGTRAHETCPSPKPCMMFPDPENCSHPLPHVKPTAVVANPSRFHHHHHHHHHPTIFYSYISHP